MLTPCLFMGVLALLAPQQPLPLTLAMKVKLHMAPAVMGILLLPA